MGLENRKTVHCPQGIIEKDIVTYFTKVQHGGCENAARAAVSLLRRYSKDTWRHATLSVETERSEDVCFVSGRGINKFFVRLGGFQQGQRAVYENLLLGFFRLLVAMAAFGQGSMVAMVCPGHMDQRTVTDLVWNVLASVHRVQALALASVVVMDTVYGPKTLFGSWVEGQADGVVEELPVEKCRAEVQTTTDRRQQTRDEKRGKAVIQGSDQRCGTGTMLAGGYRWLLRAGLYCALASCISREDLIKDGKSKFLENAVFSTAAFIPGGVLFWAALLSLAAHVMLILSPGCLVTPWARYSTGEAYLERDVGAKHTGNKFEHSASFDHDRLSFILRAIRRITVTLTALVLCSLHIIRIMCLTSSSPSDGDTSADLSLDSGLDRFDVSTDLKKAKTMLGRYHILLPAVSALTLCMFLVVWLLVLLVKSWNQRDNKKHSPVLPLALLYMCSVATLWTEGAMETVGVVLNGFARSGLWRYSGMTDSEPKVCIIAVSVIAVTLPVFLSIIIHRRHIKAFMRKLVSPASWTTWIGSAWLSKDALFRLAHAVAVTLSTCSLGFALMAGPLPWLSVRTSYSSDFRPLADALKNVSLQMTRHVVALDSLLTFPVCQEDEMSVLAADVTNSRHLLSRISVDEIEKFCLEFECKAELEPTISNQRQAHRHAGAAFCRKYCLTLAFFRGTVAFDASVHQALAREVKGNPMYEVLHLKSVILHEKKKIIDDLDNQAALRQFMPSKGARNDGIDSGRSFMQDASRHVGGEGAGEEHVIEGQQNTVDNHDHPHEDMREKETSQQQQTKDSSAPRLSVAKSHSPCMQTLCALRTVSSVGLTAPFLGFAFQAMHLAVQAMLTLLELIVRADELKVVFEDFHLRLGALALYLEHGSEERTVHLSIYNYSLVYLTYPALLTGCVGILTGFWQRHGVSPGRRYRATIAVVLPLLVLNLFGIGMTVAWTEIVESLSSLVTLVDVTSTPKAGARALLVAFTCGACSCVMFLALTAWHTRHLNIEEDITCTVERNASEAQNTVCEWSQRKRRSTTGEFKPATDPPCQVRKVDNDPESTGSRKLGLEMYRKARKAFATKFKLGRRSCFGSKAGRVTPTKHSAGGPGLVDGTNVFLDNDSAKQSYMNQPLDPRSLTSAKTMMQDGRVRFGGALSAKPVRDSGVVTSSVLKGHPCVGASSNKDDRCAHEVNIQEKLTDLPNCKEERPSLTQNRDARTKKRAFTIAYNGNESDTCASFNQSVRCLREHSQDTSSLCCAAARKRFSLMASCCDYSGIGRSERTSGSSWLLGFLLTCGGCVLMLVCLRMPTFVAHVDVRREFEDLLTQLGQGGTAVEVGRRVLLSRDQSSCDVVHIVGREVLSHYISTLEAVKVDMLLTELQVLKLKAKASVDAILPLVVVPCVVTSLVACALVLYGALSSRGLHPSSSWALSSKGAAQVLHRLTLLSLAWLLHTSLAMAGPAADSAVPAVVEMHVQLGTGFVFALAAHLVLLLGKYYPYQAF